MLWVGWALSAWMGFGCNGNSGETGDTGGPDEPWSVGATEVPGGVMLSAVTLGDRVVMAGGSYGTSGSLWRYDGDTLCVEEDVAPGALWWIHGRSETDWYAVGDNGIVLHEVDGVRTREDLPVDITLFGVYDDGAEAWIVGGAVQGDQTGQVWRKVDGGDWEQVATTPGLAFKVHEGWVVGDGFVWEWDGQAFADRTPETAPRLLTVRVRGANDVWAVGGLDRAEFWHWDGAAWSSPEGDVQCSGQALNGVYTEPGAPVWIAGNFGTASEYDDGWTCASFPITAEHFHAVWKFGDELLAVGGNLFAQSNHYATVARSPDRGPIEVTGACP